MAALETERSFWPDGESAEPSGPWKPWVEREMEISDPAGRTDQPAGVTRVTPAGWAVRPAGAEISISRSTQGFQGPLGAALSPSGQKLVAVSSAAARINSADLFDLRKRRRTGTVAYDSRRNGGEAVFYGVTFSPGGKVAWASGGGQNVVHVY